jgi:hypothetical protein
MSVDDVSLQELVKRRRYEEIRAAHDRVTEYDSELHRLFAAGQVSAETVSQQLGRAVKMFVIEVEPILNPPDGDPTSYWEDRPIGKIPLPDGDPFLVEGLDQYASLPDDLTVTVEEEYKENYYSLPETREVKKDVHVPLDVHRTAYSVTNYALADLDLGITTQDPEEAEWDADYRQTNDHYDPST